VEARQCKRGFKLAQENSCCTNVATAKFIIELYVDDMLYVEAYKKDE